MCVVDLSHALRCYHLRTQLLQCHLKVEVGSVEDTLDTGCFMHVEQGLAQCILLSSY